MIQDAFEVFDKYGLVVTNINTSPEMQEIKMHGSMHTIPVNYSQQTVEMTLTGDRDGLKKLLNLRDDLEFVQAVRESKNSAVNEQLNKLKVLLELTSENN